MRAITKLLSVAAILVLSAACLYANPYSGDISLVIIDAGHGGRDPGAVSAGVNEKDITLSIALKLDRELESRGMNTLLTRDSDIFLELQERCDLANAAAFELSGYPVFISIHANSASSPDASGFEIYTRAASKKAAFISSAASDELILKYSSYTNTQLNNYANIVNSKLASAITEEVFQTFPSQRQRGVKEGDLWVVNATWMPSVLIEVGFITNAEERRNLTSDAWQQKMAEAIATAVASF